MSRKLAGSPPGALDEIHGGHRQARAVDHAADGAIELDEGQAGLACLAVGRVLLVRIAQRLESRMAGQGGVIEGDLGVEADQSFDHRARCIRLADDREGVDLD